MHKSAEHIKIYLEYETDNEDEFGVESVWALMEADGDGYRLDNIPFYARELALGDIVSVVERDGRLHLDELLKASGHSTVRIWFSNQDDVKSTRQQIRAMGCGSEISDLPRLVAMDVPPEVPYGPIREFLDAGAKAQKWDYEEACLGQG